MEQLPNAVAHYPGNQSTGQLNPDWIEWLQGWPIGWTRLQPITLDERSWDHDPADDPGDIPRMAKNIKTRVSRVAAIGNGQVPQVVELAWNLLSK